MRRIINAIFGIVLLILLVSCGQSLPDTINNHEDISPAQPVDSIVYESNGCYLSLTTDYIDSIIVNPENKENRRENALFEVYFKPAYEQGRLNGFDSGHLFTILQLDRANYEQYLSRGDWTNEYAFACDDSNYYIMVVPTDMQVSNLEDMELYNEISEKYRPIAMDTMIRLNNLSGYSDSLFWESSETYESEHVYYRYYPYRAYPDVETSENKELYFTLMLSQPVKKGADGIWCVERVYDAPEYGWIYAIFPNREDFSAIEFYTELQVSCDKGNDRELLDPFCVALSFVNSYYGHTNAAADSFEEVQGPPEGKYRF